MEITKAVYVAIVGNADNFDADAIRKEVLIRDTASLKALEAYRLEKGIAKSVKK